MTDTGATNRLLPVVDKNELQLTQIPRVVNIIINGREHHLQTDATAISYEELCSIVSILPKYTPTVVYSNKHRSGSVTRGKYGPLVEGTIYDVVITGAA